MLSSGPEDFSCARASGEVSRATRAGTMGMRNFMGGMPPVDEASHCKPACQPRSPGSTGRAVTRRYEVQSRVTPLRLRGCHHAENVGQGPVAGVVVVLVEARLVAAHPAH